MSPNKKGATVDKVKKIGEKVVNKVGSLFKNDKISSTTAAQDIVGHKLVCIKEFLSLFRMKRQELHSEINRLNELLNHQ